MWKYRTVVMAQMDWVRKCISGWGNAFQVWEAKEVSERAANPPRARADGSIYPQAPFPERKTTQKLFIFKKLSNTTENHHFLSQIRLPSERLAILCVSRIAAVKLMLYGIILR